MILIQKSNPNFSQLAAPAAATAPANVPSTKLHVAQLIAHPRMSIATCTLVPAFAGSTPSLASPKGSALPTPTDARTMKNKEAEIAAGGAASRDAPRVALTQRRSVARGSSRPRSSSGP